MIPRLSRGREAPASMYREFLVELRLRGFEGELSATDGDRTVYATDNSIYQVLPQAVVFPRNETDVVRVAKLVREPRFRSVVVTPRGGGTGTNGQSLTDGIVVDLSRHMNRILSIDPTARTAWVEAGVVKDQLNDAIRQHGLFFAPELSPSNRATIGGMIATDASGQGSVLYGKTRDHVLELKCVLLDGTPWHAKPLDAGDLDLVKARDDRIGAVHRTLDDIVNANAALIAERYPSLNRCVTGYDLVHVRQDDGRFRLESVICGAEGTLAFVIAAKVRLTPVPRHSALFNIRYGSFDAALRDARILMQLEAASSETLDATVLSLAGGDPVWAAVASYFPDDSEGPARGVNVVEFLADDARALESTIARVEALLRPAADSPRRGYTIARDPAAIKAIWSMRKKSVGLLGNMSGERRPVPFVEDTVVPPEVLADYIGEFRAALDRRCLVYGMFGHVDAGCLHVRPALDMKDPADERMIREITDEVVALTGKYKGVLWGEHGKGLRSEYAPEFFGPLYPRLQEIKAAFDPDNQLNPGKIAAPPGRALSRIDEVPTRGQFDRHIPVTLRAANSDSLHCNGNAACFNYDPDDAMCPSWKATRDRRHSPKGRASLMREWLRLLSEARADPAGESHPPTLRSFPRRVLNTISRKSDFSREVKAAMDGCLACKSCTGQCPIKVDVPAFRSRFLEVYHGRYLRRPRDHLVSMLEAVLPRLAKARTLANAFTMNVMGRALVAQLGLVKLPALGRVDLRKALRSKGIGEASSSALRELPAGQLRRSVVVVQDAFTTFYDPEVILAFVELIQRLGFTPYIAPYLPNGKPQHVVGFLNAFQATATRNAAMLSALRETGVELVGFDPSMTLTYRAEYAKALGARAPEVLLLQEWLARHLDEMPRIAPVDTTPWALLPHCTERTNAGESLTEWKRVASRFGIDVQVMSTGCCGMAGLYGHQRESRQTSQVIYAQSWGRHIADPRLDGRVLATGYSCRSQVEIIDGKRLPHPVEVFLKQLKAATT